VANLALPFLFLLIRQIVIVFSPTIRTLSFMGFCVFVASGLNFDVDSYLKSSPFKARSIFRKGDIPAKDNPERQSRPDSGFVVLVSSEEGQGLSAQVKTAMKFNTPNTCRQSCWWSWHGSEWGLCSAPFEFLAVDLD
jgi:hypothetical protein